MSSSSTSINMSANAHLLTELYQADENNFPFAQQRFQKECPSLYEQWSLIKITLDQEIDDELMVSKIAIQELVAQFFEVLDNQTRGRVYGAVFNLANVETTDPDWGKHHAFDDIPRLLRALDQTLDLTSPPEDIVINCPEIDPSKFYSLGRKTAYEREIGYINGIGTGRDQAIHDACRFSDALLGGLNITGVWNPPKGTFGDLIASVKLAFGSKPQPVHHLVHIWKKFIAMNRHNDKKFLQICFSQGTLMTQNALNLLTPNEQARICILAVAPSCYFKENSAAQVRHFARLDDQVSTIFAKDNYRLHRRDSDIIIVDTIESTGAHDPFGQSYIDAIRPYAQHYLAHGRLF